MPKFRVAAQLEAIMGTIEVEAVDEEAAIAMVGENSDWGDTWIADSFNISYAEPLE